MRDYEKYIRRLQAFAGLASDLIELMRAGLAKGYLPSRWAMAGVVDGFRMHAAQPRRKTAFSSSRFSPFPPAVADSGPRAAARRAAGRPSRSSVAPGYQALADFIEKEYLPAIPEEIATPQLPDPSGYYAFCIRRFTSLDLTPARDPRRPGWPKWRASARRWAR